MKVKLSFHLVVPIFALATTVARAHDTWLQPMQFIAKAGSALVFEMTSADGFKGPDTAIKPDRIDHVIGRLGSEAIAFAAPVAGEKALRFTAALARPGVAMVGVELKPRVLELTPDKIELYLEEIHAGEALRALWAAVPEPRHWRESYVKHAKTFVSVGEHAATDRTWAEPLGLALEVVPERDPTALRVGDALPVRVLKNGKPLAGFTLGFVAAGETAEHVATTDAQGRASAVLDARGAWLIPGTDLRRTTAAGLEWESDFTTMVVEAK